MKQKKKRFVSIATQKTQGHKHQWTVLYFKYEVKKMKSKYFNELASFGQTPLVRDHQIIRAFSHGLPLKNRLQISLRIKITLRNQSEDRNIRICCNS